MLIVNVADDFSNHIHLLQHGEEGRRLHVGDTDLLLILCQLPVEHGVEHGAADSQDVLAKQRNNVAEVQTQYQHFQQKHSRCVRHFNRINFNPVSF